MSILQKQGTQQLGSTITLTIDKEQLKQHQKILNNSVFLDDSNWQQIGLSYKSSENNQQEIIIFKDFTSPLVKDLVLSTDFFGDLIFDRITILDKKMGSVSLKRSDFLSSDLESFDILLS